jgi:hypothetical protein
MLRKKKRKFGAFKKLVSNLQRNKQKTCNAYNYLSKQKIALVQRWILVIAGRMQMISL